MMNKTILINQRGSVLQIVLIIFMILSLSLSIICQLVLENQRAIHRIEDIRIERHIELSLLTYYKQEIKHERLENQWLLLQPYTIVYTIEDKEELFSIETTINKEERKHSFIVEIEKSNQIIRSFEYQ